MRRSLPLLVLMLLVAPFSEPALVHADEVIPPRVLIRKFPQGQFCALPVDITFIAPATPVIVTFTALQYVPDFSNVLTWTGQSIDNVTLATTTQFAAAFDGPPVGGSSENCYIGDPQPTPYFHFNRAGVVSLLLERFDDNPIPRGWDLGPGSSFSTSSSAPRDVETDSDLTGGSVALGDGTGSPSPAATASASVTLPDLVQGESYTLGAWWNADFVRFPHDQDYLTVTVTTLAGTPVARKSWGALKSSFTDR